MKTGWENARVKTWFTVPRSGQNPHCSTTASVPASWNKPLRKAGQRTSGLSQTLCRQHQLNSVQSLQHLRVSLVHSWRLAEKLHDYLSDLCQGYGLIFKHFFLLRGILIITALKKSLVFWHRFFPSPEAIIEHVYLMHILCFPSLQQLLTRFLYVGRCCGSQLQK